MNEVKSDSPCGYRPLVDGDIIQEGDEWFNPDWEVGGPWFVVDAKTGAVGQIYNKSKNRLMRRKVRDETMGQKMNEYDAGLGTTLN